MLCCVEGRDICKPKGQGHNVQVFAEYVDISNNIQGWQQKEDTDFDIWLKEGNF